MFRLTVLLIATLSAVNAIDFTVGAEFEIVNFKALGEFYRDDPLLKTDNYIIHTDMGTEYFILELATEGPINPDHFNNIFEDMNGQLGSLYNVLNRNATWAKKIFTDENLMQRVNNLKKALKYFKPFSYKSALVLPKNDLELKQIYQRFEAASTFWTDNLKLDSLDLNVGDCTFENVFPNIEVLDINASRREAFKICGAKLNEINKSLNNALKIVNDFLLDYSEGISEHKPEHAIIKKNSLPPSLFSLIQDRRIAWTHRRVNNIDRVPKRALMRYFCRKCPYNFSIANENADTLQASAHHTIGLKLEKVPQLFKYYNSEDFDKSFNSFANDKEVTDIVKKMNNGMFINSNRLLDEQHENRVRSMIGNLGLEAKYLPFDIWNEHVLAQYLDKTKKDHQIKNCDEGQGAVGLNLLFWSYAINVFIGDITNNESINIQLDTYEYGPKKALWLMSRVSFRKLYLDLQECGQQIFKDFFYTLCKNSACDQLRLVAYRDDVELLDEDEYDSELKDFSGKKYQITLHEWYNSIVYGIDVEDILLVNSKMEACSLKKNAPRESVHFDAFFDCEQTDLLSPPEPASSFVNKQALKDYFTELLLIENPVKFASLNSYMSKHHTSMGGYRNVEPGWIILENRAVAERISFSKSGRFADAHFKGIQEHVIEKEPPKEEHSEEDYSQELYTDSDQEMTYALDKNESAGRQRDTGGDMNVDFDRLVI